MTNQGQDHIAEKSADNNIMNVFQQLFQNSHSNYDITPNKNENISLFDQQSLDQLQVYFTQQQSSSSSSLLLNHEPDDLYSMLGYNQPPLYSPATTKKQFKFRKNITAEPKSSEPSLDALLLTKHQIEQEILKRKRLNDEKQQQEELLLRNKKVKKPQNPPPEEQEEEEEEEGGNGNEEEEEEDSASQPLSKDDKRKRNTAASARFRIKKKMREQALQKAACEMTEKAGQMEQRVNELEQEIKWLRALVVEKNEAKIKQLIKEKPLHSIAFPNRTEKE